MFGSTLRIAGTEKTRIDRRTDRALADYVRWEYLPADRSTVLLALKDGGRKSGRRFDRILRVLRFRWAAPAERGDRRRAGHGVRRPLRPMEPLEEGLLDRAVP